MNQFPQTKTLEGNEQKVYVGYDFCSVKNMGSETVYASTKSGIVPEANGVYTIDAGESTLIPLEYNKQVVFLYGQGKVQICGGSKPENFYNPSARGGNDVIGRKAFNAISAHTADVNIHLSSAEICKPNLLINPNFAINQRSKQVYSGDSGYCTDGWYRNSEVSVTLTNNGIELTYTGSSDPCVYQKVNDTKSLLGKTVSFSACIDGEVYSCTGIVPVLLSDVQFIAFARLDGEKTTPTNDIPHIRIQMSTSLGSMICVLSNVPNCEWTKLEIGSVPTPFSPPDTANELIKCQRIYQILRGAMCHIGSGYIIAPTSAMVVVPIQPMKKAPTIKLVGSIFITTAGYTGAGAIQSTGFSSQPSCLANASAISLPFLISEVNVSGQGCTAQFRDTESYIELIT